jgi:hypothetical protein
MMREDAEGTTETAACRFWMVSLTVTRRPFCGGVSAQLLLIKEGVKAYPITGRFCNVLTNLA